MGEKKHIDRLFQEKFKDFEATPPSHVWENIQKQLEEPKRKKRIVFLPLWSKVGGIAASLLLLLTIGNSIYNSKKSTTIVNTNTSNTTIKKHNSTGKTNVIKETITRQETKTAAGVTNNSTTENLPFSTTTKGQTKRNTQKLKHQANYNQITSTNNTLLQHASNKNLATSNTVIEKKHSNTNASIKGKKNNINRTKNKRLAYAKKRNANKDNTIEKEALKNTKESPSIEEAIAKTQKTYTKAYSSSKVIEKEKEANKWQVYANIAPVYYNSIGKGSHIDEQFVNNSKEGEINTSYGVTVGYAINDKMTLRSGLNKLDLGYNTNDAIVYESVVNHSKSTVAPGINISTHDRNTGKTVAVLNFNNLNATTSSNSFIENEITPVALNQKMSYYEVPIEVEHKVLNKRFGVNLIYGMSTFILDNNKVISQLNGLETVIGESNNINPISFSTNLGLGLDYKFSKAMKVNVEPTFKYQLNAFENTSGKFNPYVLGIYTGVSYNF